MALPTNQVSEGCLYAQLVDRFDSDSWDTECAIVSIGAIVSISAIVSVGAAAGRVRPCP